MRIDTTRNGKSRISIFDLDSGKAYWLNPEGKEVIVVDLKSASEHLKGDFMSEKLKRVIQATGKNRKISGISCNEYTFDLKASHLPTYGGSPTSQEDTGMACVSTTTPGGLEVTAFVQEAKRRGYILATEQLNPSGTSIGAYFFDEDANELVVAATSESSFILPFGPSSRSSSTTRASAIDDMNSDPIPDEEFQIPPDWKYKKGGF